MVCNDELVCVTVWTAITDYDIEASIVSVNPIWRRHLNEILDYPFNQLGYNRITARIRAGNIKSQNLAKKLGFVLEGVMREAYNGEDVYIYGLLKRDYYGQAKDSIGTESDKND